MTGANLQRADLAGADLRKANLANADLQKASLEGCDVNGANFSYSNLRDATLRGVTSANAKFTGAKFTKDTLGLGSLNQTQMNDMNLVEVESEPGNTSEGLVPRETGSVANITIEKARIFVDPALLVLQGHVIPNLPNDLSAEHRDLIEQLLSTVEELAKSLAQCKEANRHLSEELAASEKVTQALPLWKRAWETFVLKAAGTAGSAVGSGGAFIAGYVAGSLHNSFSPEGSAIVV